MCRTITKLRDRQPPRLGGPTKSSPMRSHHSQFRSSSWTRFFDGFTCHQNHIGRSLPNAVLSFKRGMPSWSASIRQPFREDGDHLPCASLSFSWFAECGVGDRRHGIDQRLLDSDFRASRRTGICRASCQRAMAGTCRGACQRCAVAASGSIRLDCCGPAFGPKGTLRSCEPTCVNASVCWSTPASHIQHMQKALTEMNFQLHNVVADIPGATGLRAWRKGRVRV